MKVFIRCFTILREVTKKRTEEIELKDSSTLKDALGFLTEKYGSDFNRYVFLASNM